MPVALYLCLHFRDFAAQAVVRAHPELRNRPLYPNARNYGACRGPLSILAGSPPLEYVFGLNDAARQQGVTLGMSRVQAESFAGMTILRRERAREDEAFAELIALANHFSPRVQALVAPEEQSSAATFIFDVSNSERLLGTAGRMADSLLAEVERAGCKASIAVAHNAYTAVLAARGLQGITIIALGGEAPTLSPLPLSVLELDSAQEQLFADWGIHSLGELAALPLKPLVMRLGQSGHRLHLLARGACDHLLVPMEDAMDAALSEHVELEHPVELLEPLLFLMSRTLEKLTLRAQERALAIASVEIRFALADGQHSEYRRTVRPALPERDHRTLLKLIQLDLELHPPRAGITAFTVYAQPDCPRKVQQGLFASQSPEAGRLEILLARLRKLVGEECVGSAELLDSHAPDAFRMTAFSSGAAPAKLYPTTRKCPCSVDPETPSPCSRTSALRMVRPPLAVHIRVSGALPAALVLDGKKLAIETYSGPWRTSGAWWSNADWCREEWDVVLKEPQQRCFHLAYDPGANCWYLIGIYD
jgi:protein ImuB